MKTETEVLSIKALTHYKRFNKISLGCAKMVEDAGKILLASHFTSVWSSIICMYKSISLLQKTFDSEVLSLAEFAN